MQQQQLENFIKNNNLNFEDTGSALNSNCTILAGYACYIQVTDFNILKTALLNTQPSILEHEVFPSLLGTFNFALENNYGKWWENPENFKKYII